MSASIDHSRLGRATADPHQSVAEVSQLLVERGFSSVTAWARAHGYEPATVRRAVRVWWPRDDRRPHGGLTRAIMRDLTDTLTRSEVP